MDFPFSMAMLVITKGYNWDTSQSILSWAWKPISHLFSSASRFWHRSCLASHVQRFLRGPSRACWEITGAVYVFLKKLWVFSTPGNYVVSVWGKCQWGFLCWTTWSCIPVCQRVITIPQLYIYIFEYHQLYMGDIYITIIYIYNNNII